MTERSRRKARRSIVKRELATRILVVTEGRLTEPQYVEMLDKHLRSPGATTVVKSVGVGRDPLRVVDKCVELRRIAAARGKAYDTCVCLIDVDEHRTLEQAISRARREEIQILVSNLKFEVWLRWHVESARAPLSSPALDKLVEKHGLLRGKNLSLTFPIDRVDEACRTAHLADPGMTAGRVGPNPSSAMPVLVRLLNGASLI